MRSNQRAPPRSVRRAMRPILTRAHGDLRLRLDVPTYICRRFFCVFISSMFGISLRPLMLLCSIAASHSKCFDHKAFPSYSWQAHSLRKVATSLSSILRSHMFARNDTSHGTLSLRALFAFSTSFYLPSPHMLKRRQDFRFLFPPLAHASTITVGLFNPCDFPNSRPRYRSESSILAPNSLELPTSNNDTRAASRFGPELGSPLADLSQLPAAITTPRLCCDVYTEFFIAQMAT